MSGDAKLENERQAGTIAVSISNYVAAAALAVLAGSVVLFTYVTQTYKVELWFYLFSGLGVAALVASIFLGGRGSDSVAKKVGKGEYVPAAGNEWFNWQAILTLVGLLFVLCAVVAGVTVARVSSELEKRVTKLEQTVSKLESQTTAAPSAARTGGG